MPIVSFPMTTRTPPTAPTSIFQRLRKRLTSGRFLFISILLHVLFAIVAVMFVVQSIKPKPRLEFTSIRSPENKQPEKQLKMQKERTMSAPAPIKKITTVGPSNVVLPDIPALPASKPAEATAMPAMGGPATSSNVVGRPSGSPSNSSQFSLFGVRTGIGLEGHFNDLKVDAQGKSTGMDLGKYGAFLKEFANGGWHISSRYHYKASPTALYAKFFFYPAIKDTEAGKAFLTPEAGPGIWLAHYKGAMRAPESGTYRFVGFGDNVLFVKFNSALVLDASDHGYTGRHRDQAGAVKFPAKSGTTPIFFGSWFTVTEGDEKPLEIAVGDEGGIFCAGLFIQKQGTDYKSGANGIPILPLFFLGPPSDAEKAALGKYLPAEDLQGPYFKSVPVHTSALDAP
jgi:hypothetical protein